MSRLPIRLRLSLAFAAAMAVLLASLGAFLYLDVRSTLDEQMRTGLETQADAALAGPFVQKDESVSQLLDRDGRVLRGFEPALARPAKRRQTVERSVPGREDDTYRLLVVPAGGGRTVLVGTSLEDRDDALTGLLTALFVGGPIALALATLLGYVLAGAVLRPVEGMRRRAAEISSETAGERLPLPRAEDEIARLGRTLNEMLDRLEAGLAHERRFVADASHELRTPLALLRAELELARRRDRSPEELRAALDSAAEEVERLSRLAEDLLVLARVDEGRLPLRREEISVRELLETVAGRFGGAVDVRALNADSIVGDRLRLEQALGNLVDNAQRYGRGIVRLEAERSDGSFTFRVTDEGDGFPPDLLPFERFTRGDDARDRGGSGLGLAIVAAIARAHGGSGHAAGSTVTLELPA